MLEIKLGENLEVKLGVGSKTRSKNSILDFPKCTDGSVLAFLKCMDGSVLVFLKCMDGSLLAHLGFSMQSAPTWFPQSRNSEVPYLLCKKSTKMSYLKQNVEYCLPSLTIPSTRNHLFLVYGTKIMLVIAGLPLTFLSIGIHLFLLQHVFNRAIGLFIVACLLLTIPSNRNHFCFLNDALS